MTFPLTECTLYYNIVSGDSYFMGKIYMWRWDKSNDCMQTNLVKWKITGILVIC